jgi:hypothetical protein
LHVKKNHHDDLLPGLAEGKEGGVDEVVDGQVSELIHKILPAHPAIITVVLYKQLV